MAYTLADLTYMIAAEMGLVREGSATSGATTYTIDTVYRTEPNDRWNGGTLWVRKDAGGAGAAPQGETAVISDFDNATAKITHSTLTAATASGDKYAISDNRITLDILTQKVNAALRNIGPIPKYEDITPVNEQTEYTLTDVLANDIRRLRYQTNSDSNDNRWLEITGWYLYDPNSAGSGHILKVPVQLDPSYTLRVDYVGPHSDIYSATDKLDESVPHLLVVYLATVECLLWRRQKTDWNRYDVDINEYKRKAELVRQSMPVLPRVQKPNRIVSENRQYKDATGTVNKVRL